MLKKKTEAGTVAAYIYEDKEGIGIALAPYGCSPVVCFGSHNGKLTIEISDKYVKDYGVEIIHYDNDWNEIITRKENANEIL